MRRKAAMNLINQVRESSNTPLSAVKQSGNKPPKQPVYAKHREEVASPRSILPRTEEAFFLRNLQEVIMYEKDLEVQKINLSLREDFNLIDAFGMLD